MSFNNVVAPINKTICNRIIESIESSNDPTNPIPLEVFVYAKDVINYLMYQPNITRTFRRSIQFEFDIQNDNYQCYLEIELCADKFHILIVYDQNYQSAINYEITPDIEKLHQLINSFFDVVKVRYQ